MNFAFIARRLGRLSWPRHRRDLRHALGRRGERAAAKHLRRRGLRILIQNYRCDAGEIDLIASDRGTLVFVEVKSRSRDDVQEPHEALRKPQISRIENAAKFFLMERRLQGRPCRFDVVTVLWPPRGAPRIEHFESAFELRHA